MARDLLPLRCFGKLPCYGDHLSYGVDPPTVAVREWVEAGRAALRVDGAPAPPETAKHRFVWAPVDAGEAVVGIIGPSRDSSVRRTFPFALTVHVPTKPFRGDWHLFPIALRPTWSALEDAYRACLEAPTRASLEEILRGSPTPAPLAPRDAESAYGEVLGGSSARLADGEGWASSGLGSVLAKAAAGLRDPAVIVDVPASRVVAEAVGDVAFWLDVLARSAGWRRTETTFFLRAERSNPDRRLLLFPGAAPVAAYAAIMDPPEGAERVASGDGPSLGELLRTARGAAT